MNKKNNIFLIVLFMFSILMLAGCGNDTKGDKLPPMVALDNTTYEVYVTTLNGIYSLDKDNGSVWNQGIGTDNISWAGIVQADDKSIFASKIGGGIYKLKISDNGSIDNVSLHAVNDYKTKSQLDNGTFYTFVLSGSAIFGCGDRGVYKSTDNGVNWKQIYTDSCSTLTVDSSGDVFLGGKDIEVLPYGKEDGWKKIPLPITARNWSTVTILYNGSIMAGTTEQRGLWISDNISPEKLTVADWTETSLPIGPWLSSIQLADENKSLLAGNGSNGGIFKSINNGTSWRQTGPDGNWLTFNILPKNASGQAILGSSKGKGLWVSMDNGTSWIQTYLFIGTINSIISNKQEVK